MTALNNPRLRLGCRIVRCLAACFLFVALSPVGAKDSNPWEAAVDLISSGDLKAAEAELDTQIQRDPHNSILLRLRGRLAGLLGNDRKAISYLRRAVASDPSDSAARYDLAKALSAAGQVQESIDEFQRLDSAPASSPYRQLASAWLPQLQRLQASLRNTEFNSPIALIDTSALDRSKRWSLAVRTGLKYDSNVPMRADALPDTNARDSWGMSLSGYGSYDVLSPEIDQSPVRLGVSASGYQLWYFNETLSDYDVTGLSVRPYLSWESQFGKTPFEVSIDGSWDVIWLGGDFYNRDFSASAALDVQVFRFLLASARYQFLNSEYENDTLLPQLFSRDGNVHDISMGLTFFAYKDVVTLGAQYGISISEAEGSQYNSVANRVEMYAGMKLPYDFDLTLSGGFQSSGYYNFTPSPGRLDSIWTAGCTLRRKLWGGLTAEIAYTFIGANSSQSFTEYTRSVVDFGLIYAF